jgi:hypothetical protein
MIKEIISNKKFVSTYLVWGLIHTTLLLMGKAEEAYKTFWPFSDNDYTESYDKSEWFFYMAIPIIVTILLNNFKDNIQITKPIDSIVKEDVLISESTSISKEYINLVAKFIKLMQSLDKHININLELESKEFFRTLFESRKIGLRGKLNEDYDQITINHKEFGHDLTFFIWILLFLESDEIKERLLSKTSDELRIQNEIIYLNIQKYAPEGQVLSLVKFLDLAPSFLEKWKNEQFEKAINGSKNAMEIIAIADLKVLVKEEMEVIVNDYIQFLSSTRVGNDKSILELQINSLAGKMKELIMSKRKLKGGFSDIQIEECIKEGTVYIKHKYLK